MNTTEYSRFLSSKTPVVGDAGRFIDDADIHPRLFPFQRAITRWAIRKGRAAIFADTGLGKSYMQLEWARHLGQRTLILAPLSVARQTTAMAQDIGIRVHYTRGGDDVIDGINITNYEIVDHFNPDAFDAVVLDESSILKSIDGKTRLRLTSLFADTPYKLCCTATPAPNDIAEIANHAEFLGIMTRADMLATFFVHDDDGWRLKKHAHDAFYRWMASWGMSVRKPSDIGDYPDDAYNLPPLTVKPVWFESNVSTNGTLFFLGLQGIQGRTTVRREVMHDRLGIVADMVNGSDEPWIVWHGLNEEGHELARLIPGSILVEGTQSPEEKALRIEGFQDGKYRVLITKPRIAGFGMNFQHCANQVFAGMNDSWEAYYQCVRRSWRFGQTRPVDIHIVLADAENDIYQNVMNKEREATVMSAELIEHVRDFEKEELGGIEEKDEYTTAETHGRDWTIMLGDSTERLAEIADNSVGLSVFSPPFLSLYTYSPTPRDVGNSRTPNEFWTHFGFIIDHLMRVTKPGRNACVHVSQVPAMLARDGYIGMKDFRGQTINAFEDAGWVYHGEVCIDKDPQAQAIRTKAKGLMFTQKNKDSAWLRPALADYILVFRKPGDNTEPILPDITNDEWIEWARPVWYGIRESDTLNVAEGRDNRDERHICPLQLGTIERCIRLWSNRGDLVLDPFTGIGSTGYEAVRLGRKFIGCELKPSYYRAAISNMRRVVIEKSQLSLFAEDQQVS